MQDDTKKAIFSMQKKRKDLGSLQPYCDIYNVPERLCKLNPNAYIPLSVSIGPLHKDRNLPITEAHKFHYLNRLLIDHGKEIQEIVNDVIAKDGWVECGRNSYPDTTWLANEEFIEMMVLDGCFILGYLYVIGNPAMVDIFASTTSWQAEIMADMIKFGNQLPLFVLRDLYAAVFGGETHDFSSFIYKNLMWVLGRSVSPKLNSPDPPVTLPAANGNDGAKHFLDFLRRLIIPSDFTGTHVIQPEDHCCHDFLGCLIIPSSSRPRETETTSTSNKQKKPVNETLVRLRYSASQLKTAGVKFQHKDKASSILDIDFDKENGVLSIPTFRISNNTELVLRNLVAFEQEKPGKDRLVSAFAAFLDDLIHTVEDVKMLTEKGIIIDNFGNPENVAAFFNNITINVYILNTRFSRVINNLEGYYNEGYHKIMADLRQNYFGSPWSGISFAAALLAIILTAIQTVYSVQQSK